MTRQEFIDGVTTWDELLDFCYGEDCTVCEDIISNDSMRDRIDDDLCEAVRDYGWESIRDMLDDINLNYDFYRIGGCLDYEPMDDRDFCAYKDDVIEWMDTGDYWDADEDDEDQEDMPADEEESVEDEPQTEDEDFSIGALIGMCNDELIQIQKAADEHREQAAAEFVQFLNSTVTVLQ